MSRKSFRVRVGEADIEVDLDLGAGNSPTDAQIEVLVDGRVHRVSRAPDRAWRVEADGEPGHHTVHLEPGSRPTSAMIDGIATDLEVRTSQEAALVAALATASGAADGGASVKSPMPGRVVRVLVEEGASVERDQPLMIVEAMKMENEVCAPSAGVVARVGATPGQAVESGHLLVELAPHPDSA